MSLITNTQDKILYDQLLELAGDRKLYLIGGYVRDLFLEEKTTDLDLMIDRDLLVFLNTVVATLSNEQKLEISSSHSRFFTSKVSFSPPYLGYKFIDFSQARKEIYPEPASKPIVSEGTVIEDLLRRDFTINSIAILGKEFIDPTEGIKDLNSKLIRIHHKNSFRDDPIRLVRAVRFLIRLGFSLEQDTAKCFKDAASENYLARVSPRRRFEELKKVLLESNRVEVLRYLNKERLLLVLCPEINSTQLDLPNNLDAEEALLQLVDPSSKSWREYISLLGLPKDQAKRLIGSLCTKS